MYQAQSYYSVILKGHFNVYEMRILLKIVQRARLATKEKGKYSEYLQRAYSSDGINLNFAIPFQELIGGSTHNYGPIKKAVENLEKNWHVEYWDRENKTWHLTSMINNVSMDYRFGILQFSCAKWLIDYILDFKNGGYRYYDFERAFSMRNPFAARLYLITCSMTTPLTFRIENIKEVLGVKDRYPRFHDFIRRVIEPSMKEIEDKGGNGFRYEIIRKFKDRPRSEPIAIKLIPVKREKKDLNIGQQIGEYKKKVPDIMTLYMSQQLGFSYKELKYNEDTLHAFSLLDNWQAKLYEIVDRCRRKRAGHGYIIGAIKSVIAELKK